MWQGKIKLIENVVFFFGYGKMAPLCFQAFSPPRPDRERATRRGVQKMDAVQFFYNRGAREAFLVFFAQVSYTLPALDFALRKENQFHD